MLIMISAFVICHIFYILYILYIEYFNSYYFNLRYFCPLQKIFEVKVEWFQHIF